MNASRRPWLRAVLALVLAAIAFGLSGCVYLRLVELKKQIGQFDKYFSVQTTDGVRLGFREPVLTIDDVRWIGLRPETTKKLGQAEQWQVRWVKELPPGVTEKGSFYIALDLGFTEGKLTAITIPESYFAILPKSFLIGVIKSLGGGKVDKSDRKVEAAVSPEEIALAQPKLPAIDKLLGVPTEERVEGAQTISRYRYVPSTKESKAGVFEMTLRFDTKSGDLLHWHGRTPVGQISFKFADPK